MISRATLADRLERANPGFAESVAAATGVEIAPDADAVITSTEHFRMVDCEACGGMLKPDIVYFGESVPETAGRGRLRRGRRSRGCCWWPGRRSPSCRAAVRPARRQARHPDRDRQPGRHPRRRVRHPQARRRLLGGPHRPARRVVRAARVTARAAPGRPRARRDAASPRQFLGRPAEHLAELRRVVGHHSRAPRDAVGAEERHHVAAVEPPRHRR